MAKKKETTIEPLKITKRCNRCGYKMWKDSDGKYHCTNADLPCVKYKPQPEE